MDLQRAYIRAISIGSDTIVFEIAEWKPDVWFELSKWSVPPHERQYLHPGFRCRVTVDLDAKRAEDLRISKWSLYD